MGVMGCTSANLDASRWGVKMYSLLWNNTIYTLSGSDNTCVCCYRHCSLLFKTQNQAELPAKSNSLSFFFFLPLCHSLLLPASETELTVDIVNCTSGDFPTPLHRLSSCLYFSYPADGFNYITSCGGGWLLALSIPWPSLFWSDRKTVTSHQCVESHSLDGCFGNERDYWLLVM